MKFHPTNLAKVTLLTLVLIFSFSCNKDSDLLAEFVVEKPQGILVNDIVVTLANQPIVIKPHVDESFEKPETITVTGTTPPNMGSAVVNGDNTITYTPDPDKTGTDEFDYTANVTNPDKSVTTETGKVTVTVTEKTPTTTPTDMGELKAFPGAHGFGRYASGGRGGKVIQVTNLNDSGNGSLRAALTASGKRTIVFRVGGTINLTSAIRVKNPDFTLAGHTAPGQGIQIAGTGGLQIEAGNFIIRHMKFRGSSVISNLRIISANGQTIDNGIIDHCSFSWPDVAEMNISFATGSNRHEVKNITVQNSILGESSRGILLYQGPYRISIYRNLFVHTQQRAILSNWPKYTPVNELGFEEINNIIHNMQINPIQASFGTKYTAIGNKRSNSSNSKTTVSHMLDLYDIGESVRENSYVFQKDNLNSLGGTSNSATNQYLKSAPFATSDIVGNLIIPSTSLDEILPTLGAFYWERDVVDSRFVNDYLNNSGKLGTYRGTVPSLKTGSPYADSDGDGMSDEWEIANNLDPKDPSDGAKDRDGDGYTNLEEFLYSLTLKK